MLEKTLESPLDCKEIKPVNPKVNQPWIFIGWPGAEAEALILWLPDVKSVLIGKDLDAGKDWGQEKRVTEDEMVGRHHWVNGHEFEQTLGDGEGQGSLVCYIPWGHKETQTSNWTTTTWKQVCVCDVYTSRIHFGTIDFFLDILAWFFFVFRKTNTAILTNVYVSVLQVFKISPRIFFILSFCDSWIG